MFLGQVFVPPPQCGYVRQLVLTGFSLDAQHTNTFCVNNKIAVV